MDTTAAPVGALFRPAKFVERHKEEGWTEPQIRWLIFQARQNGLEDAGAIVRNGRKVFIDELRFFAWLRKSRIPA